MPRHHCPFSKTIFGAEAGCGRAAIAHLPTGCDVLCHSDAGFQRCEQFAKRLLQSAQFALKYLDGEDTLTHGKLVRVRNGGLLGLYRVLYEDAEATRVTDIDAMLDDALLRYGDVDKLPYQAMLPHITRYRPRHRGRRRRD